MIVSLMAVMVVLITIIITNYDNAKHTVLMDEEKINNDKSSSISMMLETGANTGMYEVSSDTAWPTSCYTFNESLSKCVNGSSLTYDSDTNTVYFSGTSKDVCYVYFDVEVVTLAGEITYTCGGDGVNSLYYFDGEGDYTNASYEVTDLSYRFSGSSDSVNNWVCFGSDEETCPSDNLYSIIGFFLNDGGEYEMKLIKWDYATSSALGKDGDYHGAYSNGSGYYQGSNYDNIASYYWNYVNYGSSYSNSGYYNVWPYSALNTVNLNTNYWNTLESKWQDMVATHTWIVGGNTSGSSGNISGQTANNAYNYELVNYVTTQVTPTYTANIGLMYVSDYAYAADPTYWSTTTYNYDSRTYQYDWMYMGLYEWTITRSSSFSSTISYILGIDVNGSIYDIICTQYYTMVQSYSFGSAAIRPCMYLSSSVQITSGSGSVSDPYRISL